MKKVLKNLLFYINVVVACCLLLSYIAPFIDPAKILFPAYFGLIYPYLLLINLIFLLYWVIRFRKEFLLSLIVILIGWGHLMNMLPLNKSDETKIKTNDDVRIMSYNVRTFDQYSWMEEGNASDGIFKVIDDIAPDILCIQEFYTSTKTDKTEKDVLNQLADFPYHTIYYSLISSKRSGIGIATFSKYPILKTSRIPFNKTRNQAVYTDIKIDQDTVRVFNIHLQSIKLGHNNYSFIDTLSFKYSDERLREVKDIGIKLRDAFIQRSEQSTIIHRYIESSPYPVLVAGDFNDTPLSFAYRRIKKGLNDAFREAGNGFGYTYAGNIPSLRIDYILYSKDLKAIDFTRIKSIYSDHFPIYADISELKEGETP